MVKSELLSSALKARERRETEVKRGKDRKNELTEGYCGTKNGRKKGREKERSQERKKDEIVLRMKK